MYFLQVPSIGGNGGSNFTLSPSPPPPCPRPSLSIWTSLAMNPSLDSTPPPAHQGSFSTLKSPKSKPIIPQHLSPRPTNRVSPPQPKLKSVWKKFKTNSTVLFDSSKNTPETTATLLTRKHQLVVEQGFPKRSFTAEGATNLQAIKFWKWLSCSQGKCRVARESIVDGNNRIPVLWSFTDS